MFFMEKTLSAAMTRPPALFNYRIATPSPRVFPGSHPGRMVASGQLFQRHEPLIASPDPRRLDLRASVLNVFDDCQVRVYRQHSVLDVVLLVDLSASMAGQWPLVLEALASIAASALAAGDRFHFAGCDSGGALRGLPVLYREQGGIALLHDRLREHRLRLGPPQWHAVLPLLPPRRSLVFVLTDGHFALAAWRQLLLRLQGHAVVPVLAWRELDFLALPRWGLVSFQDAETGRYRTVWMRPSFKQAIVAAYAERKRQLGGLCRAYGAEALFLAAPYRAAQMQQYFLARAA